MKIGLIDLCKQIEDPRMNRKKVHKMETIIYISIAAVICGAQSEIEEFGNAKIAESHTLSSSRLLTAFSTIILS